MLGDIAFWVSCMSFAPRNTWWYACLLTEGSRTGPCSFFVAGHLPWWLLLFPIWLNFEPPLLGQNNYFSFPKSVSITSLPSLQLKALESCFLLSSLWNLGILFQGLSVLSSLKKCSSSTVIVFGCLFFFIYEIVCTWHPCQSGFLYFCCFIVYVAVIVQLCHNICHILNFDVQCLSFYCHRYKITFYQIILRPDSLKRSEGRSYSCYELFLSFLKCSVDNSIKQRKRFSDP